jgi:hypothetical protein
MHLLAHPLPAVSAVHNLAYELGEQPQGSPNVRFMPFEAQPEAGGMVNKFEQVSGLVLRILPHASGCGSWPYYSVLSDHGWSG